MSVPSPPSIPPSLNATDATAQVIYLRRSVRSVSGGGEKGVKESCHHRCPVLFRTVALYWPGGDLVDPPLRMVACAGCEKQWVVDLTKRQRLRLLSMRPSGDKRSPYELGPELLREASS